MVTSFPRPVISLQTSMAARVKAWPGPMASDRMRSMAAAESAKIVYWRPLSCRLSRTRSAWYMAKTSASKTYLFLPRW